MRSSRNLAALAVVVLLVVYSGCGGDDKKESSSKGSGGATSPKVAGSAAVAGTEAIDVSCVLPEHFAALVFKPKRIAALPLVAEQLKDEKIAEAIKKRGIDPSEVEQVVFLFSMGEIRPGRQEPLPTIVARFNHDVDAKEVLTKFGKSTGNSSTAAIEETQVAGKKCYDLKSGEGFFGYSPNPTTVILTHKSLLEKVFANGDPNGLLAERLRKTDADNDVIVAVSLDSVPNLDKMIAEGGPMKPPMDSYTSTMKAVHGGVATLNLKGPSLVTLRIDAKDAAAAETVEGLLKDSLKMAGAGLAFAKQSILPAMKQAFTPAFKLGNDALEGTTITTSGNEVSAVMKRPAGLDEVAGPLLARVKNMTRENAAIAMHQNNLRQIGLAFMNYQSTFQRFPAAAITLANARIIGGNSTPQKSPAAAIDKNQPLLSWRVAILPFIEEMPLYQEFHLDEPWDSAHNLEVAKKMPAVYQVPGRPNDGKTSIMVFTGKGTAFDGSKAVRQADITDGSALTILAVEAGPDKAVPWTKPEDLPFDPENPLAALGQISADGFPAVFFDCRVDQLKVDNKTLKALITPNGGERIDTSKLYGR